MHVLNKEIFKSTMFEHEHNSLLPHDCLRFLLEVCVISEEATQGTHTSLLQNHQCLEGFAFEPWRKYFKLSSKAIIEL